VTKPTPKGATFEIKITKTRRKILHELRVLRDSLREEKNEGTFLLLSEVLKRAQEAEMRNAEFPIVLDLFREYFHH
jgi:hypothetical protein